MKKIILNIAGWVLAGAVVTAVIYAVLISASLIAYNRFTSDLTNSYSNGQKFTYASVVATVSQYCPDGQIFATSTIIQSRNTLVFLCQTPKGQKDPLYLYGN